MLSHCGTGGFGAHGPDTGSIASALSAGSKHMRELLFFERAKGRGIQKGLV
jgi:hypothetical protein